MDEHLYFDLFESCDPNVGPRDRPVSWLKEHLIPDLEAVGIEGPLLDAGCANGYLCQLLRDQFGSITGVDYSRNRIEEARFFVQSRTVTFLVHDFRDPVPVHIRAKTIIAVCLFSSVHPAERGIVFRNLVDTLATGGRIIVYDKIATVDVDWNGFYRPLLVRDELLKWRQNGFKVDPFMLAHTTTGHPLYRIDIPVPAPSAGKAGSRPKRQAKPRAL